jgi:hypothetical protein
VLDEEDNEEEIYQQIVALDQENIHEAMNRLIDSVSGFKAKEITEISSVEFAQMLLDLDFAKFIVSGVMYRHNVPYCGHDHSEDEEGGEMA